MGEVGVIGGQVPEVEITHDCDVSRIGDQQSLFSADAGSSEHMHSAHFDDVQAQESQAFEIGLVLQDRIIDLLYEGFVSHGSLDVPDGWLLKMSGGLLYQDFEQDLVYDQR